MHRLCIVNKSNLKHFPPNYGIIVAPFGNILPFRLAHFKESLCRKSEEMSYHSFLSVHLNLIISCLYIRIYTGMIIHLTDSLEQFLINVCCFREKEACQAFRGLQGTMDLQDGKVQWVGEVARENLVTREL